MKSNFRKRKLRRAGILLVVIIVIATFWFSSQSGLESHGMSSYLVKKIMAALHITYTEDSCSFVEAVLRKAAHFFLYFCLGAGLTAFIVPRRARGVILIVFIGAVLAAADEFHQMFTSRTSSVWDVLLDTVGVIVGCLLTMLYVRKREREERDSEP